LLNMSAEWRGIEGSPVDVSLFVSNALNKDYVQSPVPNFMPFGFGYGGDLTYGEPRMYGIRLRYRFGEESK